MRFCLLSVCGSVAEGGGEREFGLDVLYESAAGSGGAGRKLLLVGGYFLLLI